MKTTSRRWQFRRPRSRPVAAGYLSYHYSHDLELQLPAPLANALSEARRARTLAEMREREAKDAAALSGQAAQQVRDAAAADDQLRREKRARELEEEDSEVEPFRRDAARQHRVYRVADLARLRERIAGVSSEEHRDVMVRKVDGFVARGLWRDVAWPSEAMLRLNDLAASCPNFAEAVEIVRGELLVARAAKRPPRIPPMLLLGHPGVGKTYFTEQLALALATSHHKLAFDTPVTAGALAGVDAQWGTGKPGMLLEAVCDGLAANPLIVLDELDKANRATNDNPMAPLHTALEPVSARKFRDVFLQFEFDASLVTWIATANDPDSIPETLRSRFTLITIKAPTAAQAIEQALAIAAGVISRDAPAGFKPIQRRLCAARAHLTPREMNQVFSAGVRQAVAQGRMHIEARDLRTVDGEDEPTTPVWLH